MDVKQVLRTVNLAAAAVLAAATLGVAHGATAPGQYIPSNLPGLLKAAKPLGATQTGKVIDVVIWLKLRNRSGLDGLVQELYDPGSPKYRRWIKPADIESRYAPAAQDAAAVKEFFSSNGLSVVEVGPQNMYVRARGTIAAVNKAFRVQLHDFKLKDQTVFANTTAPFVAGAAGSVTQVVSGLHNLQYQHPYIRQLALPSSAAGAGSASPGVAVLTAPPISADCFSGVKTESFNNGGTYPDVTLKGNGYAANSGSLGVCGYAPPEIHEAYNLTKLYEEGFDGKGQTIVIIDWCGSPSIRADANAFAAAYDLPPLTTANFKIINPTTPPTCGAPDAEINLDVEWAHAIAPGANIDLVVPPSPSFADVDSAEFFAVINGLGSVISGSYGSIEYYDDPGEVQLENLINELASVQGISAHFSSGDAGDFTGDYPRYNPATVSVPADSPYATAIGGVSLALKSDKTIAWQAGWGTNDAPIRVSGSIVDPPFGESAFYAGSGGGPSAVFGKPSYQHLLKGSARLLPDISWLADPYTGGVIAISEPGQYPEQVYEVVGGTSLSCPMFSALWAIASQEAGAWLGQASRYLYSMPASTITDILPVASTTNVTATYKESATVTDVYTAADLAAPLEGTTKFVSAIWDYPLYQDTTFVITFGTDSGLATGKGWDDVTGLGTPNGKAFADHFKP